LIADRQPLLVVHFLALDASECVLLLAGRTHFPRLFYLLVDFALQVLLLFLERLHCIAQLVDGLSRVVSNRGRRSGCVTISG